MGGRLVTAALLLATCSGPAAAFDGADLNGVWAESTFGRYACMPANRHQRFELSADGKTLKVIIVRRISGRDAETIELEVLRSDEHSIFFRFPGEHAPPDPLAGVWAITMLGPGVYRWHLTGERETPTPAPIGVRCEP